MKGCLSYTVLIQVTESEGLELVTEKNEKKKKEKRGTEKQRLK